jgi:putative colanic acid biosysnthesis UDP-glucose lipid carrier transferase
MPPRHGRYSYLIRPISYLIDLTIINLLAILVFLTSINPYEFCLVITLSWIILSLYSDFYEVRRYTREITILTLILRQLVLFSLIIFSYVSIFKIKDFSNQNLLAYIATVFFLITFFKFSVFFLLQRYRVDLGGNFRKTVIIGKNKHTLSLKHYFDNNPEYGYKLERLFDIKDKESSLETLFEFIKKESIDEIYCSLSQLSNKDLNIITDFADNNLKVLKFLPDNKDLYSRKLKYEYYGYIPILSMREIPIEEPLNHLIKRVFDVLFSMIIILGILSWLTPIIAILIKLESKGPIFFSQYRNGFNYKTFKCYKFRSMTQNDNAHLKQATKNDQRITKIGKFLRKTSIDELPQFFNVLLGDMSVVGPRPHMVSHTNMYAKKIDKFMVRHFVKPGITGLAQVKGYRGEIETDKDIVNRVKYDIFYIENWSLLLDIKIIVKTIINMIFGEPKAY